MMPKANGWSSLIRHARSHIGAVLVIAIILMVILLAVLYSPLPMTVRIIIVCVVTITVITMGIWVMARTPKTPEGPLATEDYYIFDNYLRSDYGTNGKSETRQQILKKKNLPKQVLPPPDKPKQIDEGNHNVN
jgi:hypothetical protein